MDLNILSMVMEELAAVFPGSRVDKVVPVEGGGLSLILHKGASRPILFLSPDRSLPRIHVLSYKPEPAVRPSGFYLQVKKHIAGARLTGIRLVRGDRIVELRFERSRSEEHTSELQSPKELVCR